MSIFEAIAAAESTAEQAHRDATCSESEWSCSYCEQEAGQ